MKKIYKSQEIPNREFIENLFEKYVKTLDSGEAPPDIPDKMKPLIYFDGETKLKDFEFIDKTEAEEKQELADQEELEKLKSDHEYFLNVKIRPKRDAMMISEVDNYQSKPLLWAELTAERRDEITALRTTLLNLPSTITEYKTDDEIKAIFDQLKP